MSLASSRSVMEQHISATTVPSDDGPEVDDHTHWHRQRREQAGLDLGGSSGKDLPIALEDHELDHACEIGTLWAKAVSIDDYTIVGGNAIGGSYVIWICTVETVNGGPIKIRKRYSDIDTLRKRLVKTFPDSQAAMPLLPRKSVVSRFNPQFLEKRKSGLSYFLSCVLPNPEFAGSPILKDFLHS